MTNPGAVPVDYGTSIGKFRLRTNDTTYAPLDPPVAGQGDFTYNSDAEIQGFLNDAGDSVSRGVAYFYLTLAGQAAEQSKSVADTDLKVDLTKRAEDLRKQAAAWLDLADTEDALAGTTDIFDSFSFDSGGYCRAEAAPCPVDCGC